VTPNSPSPTWYDVLGVSRDAGPDEIKAAWRHATDHFEPGSGSGQFRMFNEAADVLLDPERRHAYDASLDAAPQPPVPAAPGADTAPRASEPFEATGTARSTTGSTTASAEAPRTPKPPKPAKSDKQRRPVGEAATRTSVILAALLALLTIGALVAAGYFALQVRNDARVAEARDEAPAAAERAAKAMLAYDYRQLPTDRKRASAYLTDGFKKKYLENFTLLEKQKDGTPGAAVQTKTVVTATVLGSGVVDAEDGMARVLVYVNQVSERPGRDPQIFQNRVSMTMEKDGNRWLVDDLKSY
jgi:Mce-associated membrane protein